MDLRHNEVFRVLDPDDKGLYRVVLVDCPLERVVAARIDTEDEAPPKKTSSGVGSLRWFCFNEVQALIDTGQLLKCTIEVGSARYRALPPSHEAIYEFRQKAMADFLDLKKLHEGVLVHGGWAGLVRDAVQKHGVSRPFIYNQISNLCRLGFVARSLRPAFDRCGAPGVLRPSDPGGRCKAGRKTTSERIAKLTGQAPPKDVQPGMSTEWRLRILAADAGIRSPKPRMSQRVDMIHSSHFVSHFEEVDGRLKPVLGPRGSYPTKEQIRRVLRTAYTQLDRLIGSTTMGHFKRSLRGLKGKSWNGVAGPGHTWAIDSTIGDLYVRSSINRAWILGRPIVYVIVDVWSTAVVGFYVCLSGPSWRMARVALFNACAPAALMADLWGLGVQVTLNPAPTLCAVLLCDRGEYLSRAASADGLEARLALSYTPPYRPDYKGIVEVLHRIEKDAQYFIVPGAIDARRVEYELRRFEPWRSALTIRELVQYLAILFGTYNLTADRRNRLDAHMIGANVMPTPGGLWSWGHAIGIGFSRETSQDELICTWLDHQKAYVSREGPKFAGRLYTSPEVSTESWSARARNFGGWGIDVLSYPGSVSRIWTADHRGQGLLQLDLCDHANASGSLTLEEVADAFAIQRLKNPAIEHNRSVARVGALAETKAIVRRAVRLTAEAEARDIGPRPSITEARAIEQAGMPSRKTPKRTLVPTEASSTEAEEAYLHTMAELLEASNKD